MIKSNNYYITSRFSRQSYSGKQCDWPVTVLYWKKDIQVCAGQINLGNHIIILLWTCRSPIGNFGEFAVQLDLILKYSHKRKVEFIICGDFNINPLTDSSSAQQLMMKYSYWHNVAYLFCH